MSKLADLLNPAPSNATGSPNRPTVSTSNHAHKRNESITSPLEALALAASTSTPAAQSRPAVASPSFPPNPYLNTNPYAIKPQQSPPALRPSSHANASSPSPPASVMSPDSITKPVANSRSSPPLVARTQPSPEIAQPVVKAELSDEPAVVSAAVDPTPVKTELSSTAATEAQSEDVKMKSTLPTEPKPTREPKKTTAATKKGTAKAKKDTGDLTGAKKPMVKKRKLEPESKDGTPFSQRSGTPNSRTSKTPAQKRTPQQSPGPQALSVNGDEEYEEASEEDGEVFCICRRPDDHTWMIGCDGGCEDWFHGRCVHMNEADGNLIDKYICPNCEAAGRGKTMWKPMCRLPDCREPARVAGKKPSKYCSDEHGKQFMQERAAGKIGKSSKNDDSRKRRKAVKDANHDNELAAALNGDGSDDGHQAHLRGGVLKPGELKALVSGVKTADEFRRLGDKVSLADNIVSEPDAAPRTDTNGDIKMEDDEEESELAVPKLSFTEQERTALGIAAKQRHNLDAKLALLADRDKLLAMVRARHKSVLEELRKKDKSVKDICGYDSRLGWSDEDFDEWRNGEEGKAALANNTLPSPTGRRTEETNGNGPATGEDDEEIGRGVCKRKRCERHKTWAKLSQQEINLARSRCWHQQRKIEGDEQELKERALMRQRETR